MEFWHFLRAICFFSPFFHSFSYFHANVMCTKMIQLAKLNTCQRELFFYCAWNFLLGVDKVFCLWYVHKLTCLCTPTESFHALLHKAITVQMHTQRKQWSDEGTIVPVWALLCLSLWDFHGFSFSQMHKKKGFRAELTVYVCMVWTVQLTKSAAVQTLVR